MSGALARCVAMLLTAGWLIGCGGSDDRTVLLQDMVAQDRQWQGAAPARYELAIAFNCFCSPAQARAVVDHGQVMEFAPTGSDPVTVDWLFDQVKTGLARDYASASVDYDPVFGYPTAFHVDPQRDTIDDEFGFQVTCFASGDAHCGSASGAAAPPP